jgi:cell division protein FtsB
MNIKAILSLASIGLILFTMYHQNETINDYKTVVVDLKAKSVDTAKLKQLETQVDSLQAELFIQKTIVGRYELGINYLKERNLKDYLVVKYFIETQTE